ncbi:hypothetical protein BKA83DRAFT_4491975 [Pisolithus microcarpus]|nr:hypothetical protein BKA83DRAFT_4491975 [Pisolithus microcarpus]
MKVPEVQGDEGEGVGIEGSGKEAVVGVGQVRVEQMEETAEEGEDMAMGCNMDTSTKEETKDILTRLTEKGPFYPPRVEAIWKAIKCRPLPPDQMQQVQETIAEFADTFTLLVKEDTKFLLRVSQKPLTQAQKEWYLPVLDEFSEARILHDIRSDKVRAVHPTVLAQKAHGAPGLTMEEIRRMVEEQCKEGTEIESHKTGQSPKQAESRDLERKPKWCMCQNFHKLNKVTEVTPMPQGNIRAKQQRLVG